MSYGSRHRWFRRIALVLVFASVLFIGRTTDPSLGMDTYGDSRELPEPFVDRPDDVADRVSHSDVAPPVEPTNGDNWRLEWTDALPLGIGIIVVAVALGLALSPLRRPRLAGL